MAEIKYAIANDSSREVGTAHIIGDEISVWATETNGVPATWQLEIIEGKTVATVTPHLGGEYRLNYLLTIL